MKRSIRNLILAGALATGLVAAQTTAPANPPQAGTHRRANRMARLSNYLQLTPDQQTQAKAIFQATREQAEPLFTQMRSTRQQIAAAVKNGAPDAQIDQLTAQAGTLKGQLMAIRTKAFAKFYTILTPDQKTKMDNHMQWMMARGGRGHGPVASAAPSNQ